MGIWYHFIEKLLHLLCVTKYSQCLIGLFLQYFFIIQSHNTDTFKIFLKSYNSGITTSAITGFPRQFFDRRPIQPFDGYFSGIVHYRR